MAFVQSTCVQAAGDAHNHKQDFPASSTEVAGESRRAAAKQRGRDSTLHGSSIVHCDSGMSGLAGAIKHLAACRGRTYFSLDHGDQASPRPRGTAWWRPASSETAILRDSHLRREKLLEKIFFFLGKNLFHFASAVEQHQASLACLVKSQEWERVLPLRDYCCLENGCDQRPLAWPVIKMKKKTYTKYKGKPRQMFHVKGSQWCNSSSQC